MARSNFKVHVVINQSEHDSSPSTDQAAVEDKGHNDGATVGLLYHVISAWALFMYANAGHI